MLQHKVKEYVSIIQGNYNKFTFQIVQNFIWLINIKYIAIWLIGKADSEPEE